jgi:hypothetical protein
MWTVRDQAVDSHENFGTHVLFASIDVQCVDFQSLLETGKNRGTKHGPGEFDHMRRWSFRQCGELSKDLMVILAI